MCVGKPKIDGAREYGLCSYTGEINGSGLQAVRTWDFGAERRHV